MAVEATWRADGSTVTVEQYLDNADNLGSAFVNVSHWLANPEPTVHNGVPVDVVPHVLAAARSQQRVIRVLNDQATYERDVAWGDLNVLRLGLDRPGAEDLLARLTRECEDALVALRASQPRLATFLHRQAEFCRGFYGLTDYWGQW
jgi:terpene synthase-like protein